MSWTRPLPTHTPETKPFWDAADASRFVVQQCRACERFQFPYRGFCSHCWSAEFDERDVSGGRVFTYSVIYRNDTEGFQETVPYVAAMVQLDEDRGGLIVQSNIVGCDPELVHIGLPVRVTFAPTTDGHQIPMFTPVETP
ncbi:Zn-ribbon domain-containing OB-fold protein [Pseudonocardia endophytica]|uniref:OB-fold protein n=1 Tax=Pseudonocardia endophytica TaxID=401976 RepID=A0A4R1HQ72_PSEEN|nr:OB-fold domain-containing protein [Pseudonocardia endophytica]TCK21909.1 hypothetical protein EV378_5901 [Pseudonocardia endophytica]